MINEKKIRRFDVIVSKFFFDQVNSWGPTVSDSVKENFGKNIWYRKLVVDNKNGLTWENNERRKKITFFIFYIEMIPIFSGRFSCFPIFSIIHISGFINIFLNYLTWLGWVWEVSGMQVCVLLGPAVPILNEHLNSGGWEGRSDRGPLFKCTLFRNEFSRDLVSL